MSAMQTRDVSREIVARAVDLRPELVRSASDDGKLVMKGYMIRWDEWTEIDSLFEGNFMECFRRGSFSKTISEQGRRIKVLYDHGMDPMLGNKPLGVILRLEEDEIGVPYAVELFDAVYVAELVPALEAGELGASFRFRIIQIDKQRGRVSDWNPRGIETRAVTEALLREFGPVTFSQYEGSTAGVGSGVRSITDQLNHRKGILVPAEIEFAPSHEGIRVARERAFYERSVRYVAEAPWAIHPSTLAVIKEIIGERASGNKPSIEQIQERIGIPRERAASDTPADKPAGPVAVIPVHGPIIPRSEAMDNVSGNGMSSTAQITNMLRAALADDAVKAIVLDVDSPGGAADMVPELGAEILAARGQKPLVAVANTDAASAAYWIASAADHLAVTPSGMVGSIGVYSAHQDVSVAMHEKGVKTTLVSAGKYKVEGNPFEPLSDDAREMIQTRVDRIYDMFTQHVATARGVTQDEVVNGFGQGRMVDAHEAVELGMADEVATLDEVVARLTAEHQDSPATAGDSTAGQPEPSGATTAAAQEPEPVGATTPSPMAAEHSRSRPKHETKEQQEMDTDTFQTIDDKRARIESIQDELRSMDAEAGSQALSRENREKWDQLESERDALAADVADADARRARLAAFAGEQKDAPALPVRSERIDNGFRADRHARPSWAGDPFDLSSMRSTVFVDQESMVRELRDRAMWVVDKARFAHPNADQAATKERIELLLEATEHKDNPGAFARLILATGSPLYMRAFGKVLKNEPLTHEEQRAMSTAGSGGGYAVPYQLDPTVVDSSNGVINPIRAISRVESITVSEWRGVTSDGVVATYKAEAAEATDDSPQLAQPAITPERADVFVPFSMEIGQDWNGLQAELARMTQKAKDVLEATKFLTGAGSGSSEPEGLLTGLTGSQEVLGTSASAFVDDDVYKLEENVPAGFRQTSRILGSKAIFNKVRQFDANGGSALWERIGAGQPPELLGYPAHELSTMSGTVAPGQKILLQGDFEHYVIVERIGMTVEIIPHLFHTNANRPSGQRGFFAVWRNSAEVIVPNAFRYLRVVGT